MNYTYKTHGVCSQYIEFDLTDGIVSGVKFYGGCDGNLKAIAKLVDGKKADEIVSLLRGNLCGGKGTSCGDQLALALTAAAEQQAKEA